MINMISLLVTYFQLVLVENVICELIVEAKAGIFKGLKADDGDYNMYLGIPYASVNRSNPFGLSTPYLSFNNTSAFEAYDDSAWCPQVNEYNNNNTIVGNLDCLKLNVYVPASSPSVDIPVMIWIYGGGFRFGQFGRYYYGPNYLMRHDVILVTFNYRLGPYGFMCLDIPEVPGNQGLRDQYLAFKWVKENIKAFGGDPDQITLFGQSAGGHAIDLHLMSAKSTLYNKVILETGSAEALTMQYEADKLAPLKIAKYLGIDTKNIRKALRYLSNTDTNKIINATKNLKLQFKPCVERHFDGVEPFLTTSWIYTQVPKIKNMPVLIGFNEQETADDIFPESAEYFKNLTIVSDSLKQVFNFTNQEQDEANDIVSNFYFGDEEMTEKLKLAVTRYSSDFSYIHPVHRTILRYLENGAQNLYFYMFSYIGARNVIITEADAQLCCASHADEVSYLFNTHNLPNLTDRDQITVERMTSMWTNFAKFNDPTPETSDNLQVKWTPLTAQTYYYLNIGDKLTLGKRPLHERMAFWDLFYKKNRKYQKDFSLTNDTNV